MQNRTKTRFISAEVLISVQTDRLEAASEVKLALHHVKEDGNGGFTQLNLRNQRHL